MCGFETTSDAWDVQKKSGELPGDSSKWAP